MLLIFVLLVDFGLFVWGIFFSVLRVFCSGFLVFGGVVCCHFVVLFQRSLITSVCLENGDVPETCFSGFLV